MHRLMDKSSEFLLTFSHAVAKLFKGCKQFFSISLLILQFFFEIWSNCENENPDMWTNGQKTLNLIAFGPLVGRILKFGQYCAYTRGQYVIFCNFHTLYRFVTCPKLLTL